MFLGEPNLSRRLYHEYPPLPLASLWRWLEVRGNTRKDCCHTEAHHRREEETIWRIWNPTRWLLEWIPCGASQAQQQTLDYGWNNASVSNTSWRRARAHFISSSLLTFFAARVNTLLTFFWSALSIAAHPEELYNIPPTKMRENC